MDISYRDLIDLLEKHGDYNPDMSPKEALYISFRNNVFAPMAQPVAAHKYYTSIKGHMVGLDFDEEGYVIGIECVPPG